MRMTTDQSRKDYQKITEQFCLEGRAVSAVPYGNGHINDTVLVETAAGRDGEGRRYILQTINTKIFRDPDALTENIVSVTGYLKEQIRREGGDPLRETLTPIPVKDGSYLYRDEEGSCWRMYLYITDAVCLEQVESAQQFYESGAAFGHFQYLLRDFPAAGLHEVLPGFHDTPSRYRSFEEAVRNGNRERVRETETEIAWIRSRRENAGMLAAGLADKSLPLRVTHNDTKLNNIMMDAKTGKGICIIDLDTVMPGCALYDFGDSVRYGASTAAEDETQLARVACSLELFEAYTRGFLEGCRGSLTAREKELLVRAAWTVTLEQGVRFLTDYLLNDPYYKIRYPLHNLVRARTQLALVKDMEKKWDRMTEIVSNCVKADDDRHRGRETKAI